MQIDIVSSCQVFYLQKFIPVNIESFCFVIFSNVLMPKGTPLSTWYFYILQVFKATNKSKEPNTQCLRLCKTWVISPWRIGSEGLVTT